MISDKRNFKMCTAGMKLNMTKTFCILKVGLVGFAATSVIPCEPYCIKGLKKSALQAGVTFHVCIPQAVRLLFSLQDQAALLRHQLGHLRRHWSLSEP